MGVFSLCTLVLVIFSFLHCCAGQGYVPQFLKNKYSSLSSSGKPSGYIKTPNGISTVVEELDDPHGSSYGGEMSRSPSKVKTKTKTKTTKTKTSMGKFNGGCNGFPPSPMYAGMRCSSYGGCRADCVPDYQFPNGKTQIMVVCVDGTWKVSDEPSWETVPSCQPVCLPECQNNGICLSPGQCQCSENFSGPQCQFENKPCLNLPTIPKNSKRLCRPNQCTIECLSGHHFPDGSKITTMVCKNGQWLPGKAGWTYVPDCEAICDPSCLNGGSCLSFNMCLCPQNFRGQQCQFEADVCSAKKLQFNGGFNCSGDMETFSCSIFCPDGISFEFEPVPKYTCSYSTGEFLPSPQPQCLFPSNYEVISHSSSSHQVHSGIHGMNQGMYVTHMGSPEEEFEEFLHKVHRFKPGNPDIKNEVNQIVPTNGYENFVTNVINLVPRPGSCFTWGGIHYKTFDGKVYSFDSKCPYILLKDAVDNIFSIVIQNHPDCFNGGNLSGCYRIIKIYVQDKEYFLKRSETGHVLFASRKKVLTIPGQLPGLRINIVGDSVVLSLDSLGVVLKWDGKHLLHVEVQENMWNRTEGLCGKINGDKQDDLKTRDGFSAKSVLTFASSWKVEELEDPCNGAPTEESICSGELDQEAIKFCAGILSDARFSACFETIDITSLMDSCKSDYCSCKDVDRSLCTCETLEVYVKDCIHKGVKGVIRWRDEKTCPLQCIGGKVYMTCGPKDGQQMCGAVSQLSASDDDCNEGCYCPEGTVLHDNKCITKDQCPCRLRGKSFAPGASIQKDCNTCACSKGEWECTQISCGARCAAVGDPHYITFDGKRYDFMGQCTYYLVKADNFSIEAENVACAGSISQALNFPASVSSGLPSCTKTVTIRINGQVIKLKQNHDVVVNGIDITKIPYNISGVQIRAVSSIFLQVALPIGIEVWWDGVTRVYIDLPATFKSKTRGLCGTFNNNQKDDFLTPEDDVEQAVIPFANKWKTSEKCNDVPEVLTSHPCDTNLHNKAAAEKHCSKLKSGLFKECHWYVDPEEYFHDCLYDMCACEFQVSKCLCPTMSAYAAECSRKGIKIDWRNEVRECGIHCPGGQKYQVCGNTCTRTCSDLTLRPDCKPQCVEGCNCPEGEVLDDNGECIPIGQCKCQQDGLDFQAGYKEVRPGTHGMELCTCLNGLWKCKLATVEDIKKFPRANDLKELCDRSRNFEFTTCEDVEPRTCKNMHTYDSFTPAVCHAGCRCKEGYVLDSKNKKCVKPNECPCHHGGRSYKEKSLVQSDCNTCTCKHGKWDCTTRQCTAECSTWGDSHYKTFDGKHFDYQGQCDFVLAKGTLGGDSFDVTIQNVPCGSLGTSCSKSATIRISSGEDMETITLTKDKPVPESISKKFITVREKGIFVIVESPDLGLIVHWDKGTRVYVKVSPRWKAKIKGLCGNYNDNEADDFQTPSGGLAEVSAKIFGDSWRLQGYCPEALELEDTCAEKPDRKVWALKKCGILKSAVFAPCHSEVPLDSYFDRCVFDACACDQGGDCECLCTALAAYAQECNNRGAPVKWRTPLLCPIQCDLSCSTYSPCISTCPHETCDNLLTNSKLTKSCSEDTCVEGCSPKICPFGEIYLNDSYTSCVPRNNCKPVCMEYEDTIFFEGDLMEEDDCHSCYCSRGKKICKGQPCAPTIPPTSTTIQNEQNVLCVEGWTNWINQDKVISGRKNKEKVKLSDVEPLPSAVILNNSQGSSKCNIEEMVSIECLTVDGLEPKELGLDVECSLEKGLICKSADAENPCPDFKIRVLCQCSKSTYVMNPLTEAPPCDVSRPSQEHPMDCHKFLQCLPTVKGYELVEKTCGQYMMYNSNSMNCDSVNNVLRIKPSCGVSEFTDSPGTTKCPPGMVHDNCAIECDRLCSYYMFTIREKGLCEEGTKCESGCVSAEKRLQCPRDHLWLNEKTCVAKHDCMCLSDNDKPVKPGQVIKEGMCKHCQCIDNFYSCNEENCKDEFREGTLSTTVTQKDELMSTPPAYMLPSVSPPPRCSEDRYINLIQGDQPLPDNAFSASSTLSQAFAPSNARLDGKITEKSGGSWAPQYTNQEQYLEIDFGRQEPVYGVIIKGSPLYDEYVTSYMVQYNPDDTTDFYYVLNNESPPRPEIFRGAVDSSTPIKQIFSTPFEANKVRIKPLTWNIGISLRVEIIGCAEEQPNTTPSYEYLTSQFPVIAALCDDEMGLTNGSLLDQQISVSSEISPLYGKTQIRLNSSSAWQPLSDSPTEWVQFDFLEPRDLTGVVTKGGEKGWVKTYIVKYSQNGKDWNPILDDKTRDEKIFFGNFDRSTPLVNNFIMPINARYLRLVPLKWHNSIQLRVEIHGCYKPYPYEDLPKTTSEPRFQCNNCPGLEEGILELEACRCLSDLWFNGLKCVNRTQCPCMVGHMTYEVGSVFEEEDCSECICKLGGVSHCTPKHCAPCKEGLRSTVTSTCRCTCQPCPEDTIICPTSNICINSSLWCNGVQDCPDDELNCTTTSATTSMPTKKPNKCPIVECQPGYKKVQEEPIVQDKTDKSYLSPLLSGPGSTRTKQKSAYSAVKSSTEIGTKATYIKNNRLSRPQSNKEVEEEFICPVVKCVINKPPPDFVHTIDECPPIVCQPGFLPILDNYSDHKTKSCPTYSCYPQPLPDSVCNITGRSFNTFDDTEFKYDICNHVIGRDLGNEEWEVSLKKNCSEVCSRDLIIVHNKHEIVIRSDLSIKYDGYEYTVAHIKNIGSKREGFTIIQLGNTVLFVSDRYGFWIVWNKLANVKFGVVHKLSRKVDGLCGYFNDIPEDDKRKPDGTLARTTAEFGNSWALSQDQPQWCEARACPIHIQNKAWEMCTKVKEQPLGQCAVALNIEAFISRCLDTVCACLEKAGNNHTAADECRCNAMQSFVVDCLSADTTIDLSDWRMQQDCPAACDAPLVYHDCYQRKCEPTCESIADPYVCPKVSKMCFPGCYCPAGHVRKDNSCIKPSSCRDCECNVLPHLQYVTYDESNFTVSGNCVYVMSRDALLGDEDTHKWQVLITNNPCKNKPEKMCVGKVTILYQGHKIHILMDYYRNRLKLIVDSERIADFAEIEDFAKVRETATKHMKILLIDEQLEVSVYYPSLGVSVKAPSHKYGGKLEGLCGDCNKNPDDDIRTGPFDGHRGQKPKDINDFALSWLYEHLPGGQTRGECENKPEEKCAEVAPGDDPCLQLLDVHKFGQCLNILDPSLFLDWCKKDTCGNHPELSCAAVEAFARDCAASGFCVNWRNEHCPAASCPSDQHYEPCASTKQETCEDAKGKREKIKRVETSKGVIEGCYCAQGKVLLNNTCVLPNDCDVCDDEGHHPGDIWKKDKCTTCKCEGSSLKCVTQYCPGKETVCERGFNALKLPIQEETCCDKYACVPEPTAGPTCETPQKLICAPDQVLKLDTKPNGCQTFICECKPKDECEKVELNNQELLEPGYVREVDENGCCPFVKLICKKETCPKAKVCPQYHTLRKDEVTGQCCPLFTCEPPKDKCIFETHYTAAENGGERALARYEKQSILKPGNSSWQDGPCRHCKCVLTSVGNYQPTCMQTECASIQTHEDYQDYELTAILIPNECCPRVKRSACKFKDKVYKIGEQWQLDGDYCKTYSCVESNTVQLETSVQNCGMKECKTGFKYEDVPPGYKECCGKCIQVACVVDDVVRNVGEEWTSSDHCTNYFCLNLNGSLQVEAVKVNCPEISADDQKDFVYKSYPVEGQCCKKHKAVACRVGEKIYKIGETWPSPDGNKCKNVTCVKKPNKDELVKQESVETCKRDCSKGWEYKESNTKCCGQCVQTHCVVNQQLKKPEESWKSEDGCVTYSCDYLGGHLLISSNHETCPSIGDCPSENIYPKGCCKYCNITKEPTIFCSPQPIQLNKTVQMIEVTRRENGKCINKHPIRDFTECVGTCHSATSFNAKSGMHESLCFCCQATKYHSLDVGLECEDGHKWTKKVAVPSECHCKTCGGGESAPPGA